jgi:hypothetical protein
MKDMGIIQGSAAQAVPLIIGKDTVYVHTDITPVEGEEGLFQYHEVQYEKDEYIKMLAEKNQSLEEQLTDTQLALVEVYELIIL